MSKKDIKEKLREHVEQNKEAYAKMGTVDEPSEPIPADVEVEQFEDDRIEEIREYRDALRRKTESNPPHIQTAVSAESVADKLDEILDDD